MFAINKNYIFEDMLFKRKGSQSIKQNQMKNLTELESIQLQTNYISFNNIDSELLRFDSDQQEQDEFNCFISADSNSINREISQNNNFNTLNQDEHQQEHFIGKATPISSNEDSIMCNQGQDQQDLSPESEKTNHVNQEKTNFLEKKRKNDSDLLENKILNNFINSVQKYTNEIIHVIVNKWKLRKLQKNNQPLSNKIDNLFKSDIRSYFYNDDLSKKYKKDYKNTKIIDMLENKYPFLKSFLRTKWKDLYENQYLNGKEYNFTEEDGLEEEKKEILKK